MKQLDNQLNKLLKLTCQAYQRNQFPPTSVLIRSSQFSKTRWYRAMLNKVSIGEAAVHYGVSQTTIHTWIKENKIQSERVSGRRWVFLEDETSQDASQETSQPDDETYQDELNFKIENEYLKQKVIDKEKQVEEANNQINELLKQQNQAQQLSAMQQKTIDKLTEQNQLLLETTQQKKPSFWQRLIGQKI